MAHTVAVYIVTTPLPALITLFSFQGSHVINLQLSLMVRSLTQNRTIRFLMQLSMNVMLDSDWLEGPTKSNVIEMETGRSLMLSAMVRLYFSFIYSNKDLQNVLIDRPFSFSKKEPGSSDIFIRFYTKGLIV